MDHFPNLTHCIAAQTVVLAQMGMRDQRCGGAGQLLVEAACTFARVNWLWNCTENSGYDYSQAAAQKLCILRFLFYFFIFCNSCLEKRN